MTDNVAGDVGSSAARAGGGGDSAAPAAAPGPVPDVTGGRERGAKGREGDGGPAVAASAALPGTSTSRRQGAVPGDLDGYRRAFEDFVPDDGLELFPSREGFDRVFSAFRSWDDGSGSGDNTVALVGRPGTGSSVMSRTLFKRLSRHCECFHVHLDRYSIAKDGLAGALGAQLGCGRSAGMDDLLKALGDSERKVVFLDACHNLFIRKVGGFEALYQLHHIFSFSRDGVFWICQWSPFTWYYLKRTIGFDGYFDLVVPLPQLPVESLVSWLKAKHDSTGLVVSFKGKSGKFWAGGDRWMPTEHSRYLQECAGGDLDAAVALWLSSVSYTGDGTVEVAPFPAFDESVLQGLGDEDFYVLCSLLFHEEISLEHLAEDMNLDEMTTRTRVELMLGRGLIDCDRGPGLYSVAPLALQSVSAALVKRNLVDIHESTA